MVDNPNYKHHLKPKQYEVCWNKGTEAPFSGKYHDCKDKASTSVSAAAIAYLPLTPSLILALGDLASGLRLMKEV